MSATLQIIVDLQNNASGPLKGLRSDVEGLGSDAEKASGGFNSLQSAGAVAAGALAGGIAIAGAALVSFAADSVRLASDMEAQVSNIAAVWGTTADAISPVKDLIGDLALDPNLKVSAVEAALAIENLAKNGLTMDDVLNGAAHSTVLLANATGADFGLAANIASDAMALFNISAADMSQAVNGITSVTVASKFGIEDYALALAQGGGVAAMVGVSFQDFNTTIAAISPFFKSGSDAGTSFKTFLQRLIPTTANATEMMAQLGIITEDGSNRFFDAQGNMKSMAEVAGILNETIGPLNDAQRNLALSTMFGSDAMRAAGAMAGFTQQEFEQLARVMGDTDALEQAKTRIDNLKGSWEIFSGVVEALKLQFGSALIPVLRMVVDFMTNQLAGAGMAVLTTFENIAESFTMFFEAIQGGQEPIAALGGLIQQLALNFGASMETATALGAAISGLVGFVVGAVSSFVSFVGQFITWKDVIIGVGIAILSFVIPVIASLVSGLVTLFAPIAAVIVAVAALRIAWESNFLGIRTAVETFVSTIYNLIGAVSSALSGDMTGFLSFFERLPPSIQAVVPGLLSFIQTIGNLVNYFRLVVTDGDHLNSFLSQLPGPIQGIVSAIGQFLAPTFDRIREGLAGFREALIPVGEKLQELGGAFLNLWNAVQPVIAVIGGALAGAFVLLTKVLGELFGNWLQAAPQMIGAVVTAVTGFVNMIASAISGVVNVVKALLTGDWAGAWEAAKTAVSGVMEGIRGILEGAGTWLDGFASLIWNTLVNIANDLLGTALPSWETFRDKVIEVVGGIATGISERAGDFIAAVQTVIDTIKGVFEGETTWGEVGSSIIAAIGEGIKLAGNLISDAFTAVKDAIFNWAGAEDWGGVADTIAGKIADFLAAAGDVISGKLSEWQTAIFNWAGAEDWAGVADHIAGKVAEFLGAAADLIGGALSEWQTAIFDWAGAEDWGGVADKIAEMIGDALGELGDIVSGQLSEWQAAIFEWAGAEDWLGVAQTIATMIGEALGGLVDLIVSGLSEWYQGFVDWVSGVDWEAIGQSIVETVILGLLDFVSLVGTALAEWYQAVADYIAGIDWYQIGYDVAYFIVDGLAEFVNAVGDTLSTWYTAVSDFLAGIDWAAIGQSIVEWITNGLKEISTFLTVTLPGWVTQFKTIVDTLGWDGIALAIIGFIFAKLNEIQTEASTAANTWVTELKAAVSAKLSELAQIGSDIIGGIVAGIQAAAGAIGDALRGIAGGAAAAGRDAFQEQSPSKLFIPIGEGVTQGLAVGVLAAEGDLIGAIAQLAAGVETEGLKAFGEAMTALAEGLAAGMNAILDLSFLDLPQGNLVETFQALAAMMGQLVGAVLSANTFAAESLKGLGEFLKIVDQISDLVGPIITAVSQINEFGSIRLDNFHEGLAQLAYTILMVVGAVANLNVYGLEVLERMGAFAEVVGSIADLISPMIAGLIELNGFGAMRLDFFHEGLAQLAYTILLIATQVETLAVYGLQTLERMGAFAEVVGSIANLISPLIAGLIELNGFGAMRLDFFHEGLAQLGYVILMVVNELNEINTLGAYALQQLGAFVNTVGAIANLIGPIISGLISIGGLSIHIQDIIQNVVNFRNGVYTLVYYIANAAEMFTGGTLQHAQAFADTAGKVVDLIVPAVEGLQALSGASIHIQDIIQNVVNFRNGVYTLVYYIANAAEMFTGGTLQHAQAFADTAGKVVDLIVPAVEGLQALTGASIHIQDIIQNVVNFRNGIYTLVYYMAEASSHFAGEMLQHVQTFAETAGAVFELVSEGIETLALLAGYVQASGLSVAAGGFAADLVLVISTLVAAIQTAGLLANAAVAEAAELADGLGDILGAIEDGVDALAALATYVQVTGLAGLAQAFAADLALTINTVVNGLQAAGVLANGAVVAAGELAKGIGDILGAIEDGVDALTALATYVQVAGLAGLVQAFAADLALTINTIVNGLQAAGVLANAALVQAGEVAKAIGDVLKAVEEGVGALTALATYVQIAGLAGLVQAFAADLALTINTIVNGLQAAGVLANAAITAAGELAGAIGDVLGVVGEGVEAIASLAEYVAGGVSQASASAFAADLALIITTLVNGLQAAGVLANAALAQAGEVADQLTALLEVVSPGLEAISGIADYVSGANLQEKATNFTQDLIAVATTLATGLASSNLALSGALDQAAGIAEKLTQLLDTVKPGIDALGAIADYTSKANLQEKANSFTQDLIGVSTVLVNGLTQAANSLGGEAIGAASSFANAVVSIAQAVTEAVNLLTGLAGSKTPDVTPIMNYVTTSAQTIAAAATAAGSIGSAVQYVQVFRTAVEAVVTEVLSAIESLGRLASANAPGSLQNIIDQMVNSLRTSTPNFAGAGQAIAEAVINGIAGGDYDGAGKEAVDKLIAGIESMRGAAEGGMTGLINSVIQAGKAAAGGFTQVGQEMVANMIAGVTSQQGQLVAAVVRVFSDSINAARGVAREAFSVAQELGRAGVEGILSMRSALDSAGASAGQAIIDGLIRAIRNGQSSVVNAIKAMLQAAVSAAQQALGINSPSKVFADMGQLMMLGLEAGIGQGAKRAISQVRSSIKDINAAARLQASAVPLNFVTGSSVMALAGAGMGGPVTLPPIGTGAGMGGGSSVTNDVQVSVNISGGSGLTANDVAQAVKRAVDQAMLESGRRADAVRRLR